MGYVRYSVRPEKAVDLQLCLGQENLCHRAGLYLPDLEVGGVGSGHYGVEITVPVAALKAAEKESEMLPIVATAYSEAVLYRLDLNTALDVPWRENLVEGLPEAEGTVANRDLGCDGEAAALHIDQPACEFRFNPATHSDLKPAGILT